MIVALLFENTVVLAGILVVVVLLFLIRWANRRDGSSVRALLASAGVALALPALSVLVVTQREEIIATCHAMALAVDDGDVAAIAAFLDETCVVGGLSREAFLERLEDVLTRFRVDQPRLRGFEVVADPAGGTVAEFTASAQIRAVEGVWDRVPTQWRVSLRRVGHAWRVTGIDSIPVTRCISKGQTTGCDPEPMKRNRCPRNDATKVNEENIATNERSHPVTCSVRSSLSLNHPPTSRFAACVPNPTAVGSYPCAVGTVDRSRPDNRFLVFRDNRHDAGTQHRKQKQSKHASQILPH